MANKHTFKYFPTCAEEISTYVDNLLTETLKTNFEAEKLLLHSLLTVMFASGIDKGSITPHSVLHMLGMTSVEDNEGYTMVDRMYMETADDVDSNSVINLYWYMKETPIFVDTIIRLISVFQFYDNLFDEPVFSEDGKVLLCYPCHLKNAVYSIPDGVEKIASHSFVSNPYINTIKIPKTVKFIQRNSFNSLLNLKAFIVHKDNETFFSDVGILYRGYKNRTIVKYPSGIKNTFVIIKSDVKKVWSFAFEACNNIKEVAFETANTKLEDNAFFGCRHIDNIAVMDGNGNALNMRGFNGMTMEDVSNQPKSNEQLEGSTHEQPHETISENNLEYRIPTEIKQMFDDYIVGHEDAKKTLSVAVYSHILRCNNRTSGIGKSNILLCGPTGCGKTEFARTIAKCLNVPFVTADATSITETGMKGNDPTDMLKDLLIAANNDLSKAQNGIIYIDEIDKLATYGENAYRESYSKGVQQGLLKIVEGGIVPIRIDNPMQQYTINFDTSNILFIAGGAFGNMTNTDVKKKEIIGFVKTSAEQPKAIVNNKKLDAKDFIKYGMTQEFVGRFPVIVQLNQLTENEIYRIMTEPKNSVITQYKNLVRCIGSELVFDEELLKTIASDAVKTGTGARGLRTVIEQMVENVIFDLPNKNNIEKVLIHKEMLNGESPKYIEKIKPKHTEKKQQTNRPPHSRQSKPNRPQRRHRSEEKS